MLDGDETDMHLQPSRANIVSFAQKKTCRELMRVLAERDPKARAWCPGRESICLLL